MKTIENYLNTLVNAVKGSLRPFFAGAALAAACIAAQPANAQGAMKPNIYGLTNSAGGAASFSITNGAFAIATGTAAQSNVMSQPFPIWRDRGCNLHVGFWGASASTAPVNFIVRTATPQKLGGVLLTNWTSLGITNSANLNGTTEVFATINIPKSIVDNESLGQLYAISNASGVIVFIDPTNTFISTIP